MRGVAWGVEAKLRPRISIWAAGWSVVLVTKMEAPGGEGTGLKATCGGEQEREDELSLNRAEFEVPLRPQVQLSSRSLDVRV